MSKLILTLFSILCLTGCQIGYIVKSGYHQAEILTSRVPIQKVLQSSRYDDETKKRLQLVEEVRKFAKEELGLKITNQYSSYVQLDRSHVSYVLSAAPRFELEHHLWDYPIVGSLPYRGYFTPDEAKAEALKMKELGFDTYVRGVSAFSTLGWFDDPVLSSMMNYSDYDLVNLIIHESVHSTLYISSQADFNERLATFLGNIGAEIFFRKREGADSPTLKSAMLENADESSFSEFISAEIKELESWYQNQSEPNVEMKKARLLEIQNRFASNLKPKLKTDRYLRFEKAELNNAYLLLYKTYISDLSDFQKAHEKLGQDFKKTLEFCISLEKSKDPENDLKAF